MPKSLVKNYVHITFSTKGRYPFIDKAIARELFSYLAGICKNNESWPVEIGGYLDHVHILCVLSKKVALMKLVEELKSHSSKWIKTKGQSYRNFYWQNGYGAFSVNPKGIEVVREYILNQEVHHTSGTFKDEYRAFLKKYSIEFDERYVWD
ncbi:IS200/IS605 family transposase [Anaerophaga thermohalophila]|uniref:IS200/IS605 family transposase n=1 Tax=Anaerophaga thermohalophila TaxID=177400 RepID=UPI000237C66C|nr:IS200/IS605 family transposase [Anaerophaga thermohalophila]